MGAFSRTVQAEQDLIDIWTYIAGDNATAATGLLDDIDAACAMLADHPRVGREVSSVRPGLRLFPVGRYLILFRRGDRLVEIVRVVHGARQWQKLLG